MNIRVVHFSFFSAIILILSCSGYKGGIDNPVNASVLGDEYFADQAKGDKKYKGKYLTVEGELSESYINKFQENILILIDKDKKQGVKCTLIKAKKPLEKPFKLGDTIKLNGRCAGFNEYVLLTGCIILKE
jgi:hypothetical protein